MIVVRPLGADDQPWKERVLQATWGNVVARKGALVDILALEGIVALHEGRRSGLLTYAVRGDEFEVVTVQADPEGLGIGRALMDAAKALAEPLDARRLWLTTTNDNIRAISFYQQWGMDLVALYRNGVERSRKLKPSIPVSGAGGIRIRHEMEFELRLGM